MSVHAFGSTEYLKDIERLTAQGSKKAAGAPAAVNLVRADGVRPEPIKWLWRGWIARGKLHVLAGAPGTGKTSAAVALAATVTIGGRWPDGTIADPGDVFIWSGEDDIKDTLVPRLIAARADLKRVHFVSGITEDGKTRSFDPATDANALNDQIALMTPGPVLLIVDPIVSAVSGDSHKNAEVRRALQPLVDLAMTRDCAVLGITHFSKGTVGKDPVDRVNGSLAFGALARVVLVAAKLPDEQGGGRLFARAKSNIGSDAGGFKYDLDVCDALPGIETTRVLWGEAVTGTARELLGQAEGNDGEDHSALKDAKGFLRMMLEAGPVPSKRIQNEARDSGHTWATVRRAASDLGVLKTRTGGLAKDGKWVWQLDTKGLINPRPKMMSTLGNDEHLSRKSSTYTCSSTCSKKGDEHLSANAVTTGIHGTKNTPKTPKVLNQAEDGGFEHLNDDPDGAEEF